MALPPATLAILVELLEIAIKHGIPGLVKFIRSLEDDDPTPEQIRAKKVAMPESWFEEGGD